MNQFKKISLTPPPAKMVTEFRRLTGMAPLYEEEEVKPVDISGDQIDPEDQIEPDDAKDRDKKEDELRQAVDMLDKKKVVYDGKPTGSVPRKKK